MNKKSLLGWIASQHFTVQIPDPFEEWMNRLKAWHLMAARMDEGY